MKAVRDLLDRQLEGQQVLVSFSCGPDSVALTHLLLECLDPSLIHVLYVDHGLRESAQAERDFVVSFAKEFKLSFSIKRAPVKKGALKKGRSIEMEGRFWRRRFLSHIARLHRCSTVLMGHHQDDNVETALFRLISGTKRGLGMKVLTKLESDIILFRPLLSLNKKALLEYLSTGGYKYLVDESNTDLTFARNKVRHHVLPSMTEINPQAMASLSSFLRYSEDAFDFIDKILTPLFDFCVSVKTDAVIVNRHHFSEQDSFARLFMLQKICQHVYSEIDGRYEDAHIRALDNAIGAAKNGARLDLPLEIQGIAQYDTYRIGGVKESVTLDEVCPIAVGIYRCGFLGCVRVSLSKEGDKTSTSTSAVLGLDSFSDSANFIIRYAEEGDVFIPFNSTRERSLNRYFKESKIPKLHRAEIPLFFLDNHLVWIVGYSISESCRVTASTRKYVQVELLNG